MLSIVLMALCGLVASPADAEDTTPPSPPTALAPTPAQALKLDALALERELRLLEDEVLLPPAAQLAVFVSMDPAAALPVESLRLQLDGRDLGGHLYSAAEREALQRGGLQRVHLGPLAPGTHELVALFTPAPTATGAAVAAVPVRLRFDKTATAAAIELRIGAAGASAPVEARLWK